MSEVQGGVGVVSALLFWEGHNKGIEVEGQAMSNGVMDNCVSPQDRFRDSRLERGR